MVLKWLDATRSVAFGRELAAFIMEDLSHSLQKRDAKFAAKAEKVLAKAARKITDFKAAERLNFYKKSKLANEFLWALKEAGCPHDYTNELTRWLTVRLG
ncbi:MAG TPA: hypothetical protein VMG61_14285 [Usitatibacter sp.]|nr:hypothetical protein [Usitatibacter sp.]